MFPNGGLSLFLRQYTHAKGRAVLYFNTCTVHLLLFFTMANKCTIISQIITLLHVSTLLFHSQGACNQILVKSQKYFKHSCW
jgi:hypothetical protein